MVALLRDGTGGRVRLGHSSVKPFIPHAELSKLAKQGPDHYMSYHETRGDPGLLKDGRRDGDHILETLLTGMNGLWALDLRNCRRLVSQVCSCGVCDIRHASASLLSYIYRYLHVYLLCVYTYR